jgi:hypothetical protein
VSVRAKGSEMGRVQYLFLGKTSGVQHGILTPGQVLHAPQRVQGQLAAVSSIMPPDVAPLSKREEQSHNPWES